MTYDFFADWPQDFDRPNRMAVHPPKPVVVDLSAILPPPTGRQPRLPLRVRQAGLALSGQVTGELLGWARVTDGRWLALVRMVVPVAARRGSLPMLQWVPAAAVSPV